MVINGSAVRGFRRNRRIAAKAFAAQIGISPQYLCDIEQGRRLLVNNPGLIKKIADGLGVTTADVEAAEAVA